MLSVTVLMKAKGYHEKKDKKQNLKNTVTYTLTKIQKAQYTD